MIRIANEYVPARTLVLALTEALAVAGCLVLAIVLTTGSGAAAKDYLLHNNGAGRVGLAVLVFLVSMVYFDLYRTAVLTNRREVVVRLVSVLGTTFAAVAVMYYVFPDESLGGSVLWFGILFVAVVIPFWRMSFFSASRSEHLTDRTLVFGDGPLARPLIESIVRHPELGVRVAGFVGAVSPVPEVPCVEPSELLEFLSHQRVDRVIVTMGERRGKLDVSELLQLKAGGVHIEDGPAYYETLTGRIPLESLRLDWLLFSPGFHVRPGLRVYKRVLSLFSGSILLLLTAPLMLLLAIAIRLDSRGPVFLCDKRLGENGVPFTLLKFRTLLHLPADAPGAAMAQDYVAANAGFASPGVTRVGKFLRRTRLDSLPELFSIVKGDMTFVGPRPLSLEEEARCAEQIPFFRERRLIKPGATGWGQINRRFHASIEHYRESLTYDLFYIKNVSFGLDTFIVFASLKILFLGR